MSDMLRKFVWPLFRTLCFTAVAQGALLYLREEHQLDASRRVAEMLGVIKDTTVLVPSWIGFMLAGTIGVIGSCVWEMWKRRSIKYENSKDNKNIGDLPSIKWLNDWTPTDKFVRSLQDLANQYTNVKLTYFDASHFPFVERLSSTFAHAGWKVNFNRTAQGLYNPHYFGGIEIKGSNRYLVETISLSLKETGCPGVVSLIEATQISQDNPKFEYTCNGIWIRIGYVEQKP
jgi:hypothetical protein